MQWGRPLGTGISVAQRSGTNSQPISRALDAGKSAFKSDVTVNMALTKSSVQSAFSERIICKSSWVASLISAASL